ECRHPRSEIAAAQDIGDHFRHAQQSSVFQSFSATDKKYFRAERRRHAFEERSTMLRRHDTDDDLRGIERSVEIVGRLNRFGQDEVRQEVFVDSFSCDAIRNVQFVSPEPDVVRNMVRDMVSPFTSQDDCQCGAPGACADDCYAAHRRVAPNVPDFVPDSVPNFVPDSFPNFLPNLVSVPAARRPMLWRCLQMTSAETSAIKISCR